MGYDLTEYPCDQRMLKIRSMNAMLYAPSRLHRETLADN
jgi:hypothetical protein